MKDEKLLDKTVDTKTGKSYSFNAFKNKASDNFILAFICILVGLLFAPMLLLGIYFLVVGIQLKTKSIRNTILWCIGILVALYAVVLVVGFALMEEDADAQKDNDLSIVYDIDALGIDALINEYRAEQGLEKLQRNSRLCESAQAKLNDMIVRNFWGHENPEGDTFVSYASFRTPKVAENMAFGQQDNLQVVKDWKVSVDGHNESMLSTEVNSICTVVKTGIEYYNGEDRTSLIVTWFADLR